MTSDVGQRRSHGSPAGRATLDEVARMRWREPRRAAELAQEVLGEAAASGETGNRLRAAGWLLHCRSAVGDAREVALELLADVDTRPGRDVLRRPEAGRLRVELAALAQSNGDPDIARDLLDGPRPAGPDGGAEQDELELDRLAVLVRCALVDGSDDLSDLRAAVESLSRRLSGEAEALAELLLGSVHRDDGEPAAAAERALRGLARLGWTPADPATPPASPHLGCALLSQWATALLEDGASADIPDGVKQLEIPDGGRHAVLWRLAVARAFAGRARPTADVLEDAASAAAAVDAPSLEAACRSAQAELYEGAGRYPEALAAVRAAVAAERIDRERAERLREALRGPAAALAESAATAPGYPEEAPDGGLPGDGTAQPDRLPPPQDVADLVDRSPARAASASGSGVDPVPTGVGPAMATLDLGVFDGAADRSRVNGHASRSSASAEGGTSPGLLDRIPSVEEWTGEPRSATGPGSGRIGADPDGGPRDPGAGTTGPAGGGEPSRDRRTDGAAAGERPAGTGRPDGREPSGPALPAADVASQLPGSRGADAASGDGEGSPLADALLAELREPAGPIPSSQARSPATGTDGDKDPAAGGSRIVLELVGGDGRPVRHPGTADVGADLAAHAERLVPAGSDVRALDDPDGPAGADGLVEVSVPGATGVALQLWARSLVGHLATRVSRGSLPDPTSLRVRVHGSGRTVGEVWERPLTAPSTSDDPRPSGPGDTRTVTPGRPEDPDGAARGPLAGLDVRPGTGGRRRRAEQAPADHTRHAGAGTGVPVNGAPVRQDPAEEPAEEVTGRRRRRRAGTADGDGPVPGLDGPVPGVDGARPMVDGRRRSHRHGRDETSSADEGAGSARDAHPASNGRRPHAGAGGAAAAMPGDAGAAENAATAEGGDTASPPRGTGARQARRPDPLDTSIPVEDVVPDGAVWRQGEWVVPGPLEQAAVASVREGVASLPGPDDAALADGIAPEAVSTSAGVGRDDGGPVAPGADGAGDPEEPYARRAVRRRRLLSDGAAGTDPGTGAGLSPVADPTGPGGAGHADARVDRAEERAGSRHGRASGDVLGADPGTEPGSDADAAPEVPGAATAGAQDGAGPRAGVEDESSTGSADGAGSALPAEPATPGAGPATTGAGPATDAGPATGAEPAATDVGPATDAEPATGAGWDAGAGSDAGARPGSGGEPATGAEPATGEGQATGAEPATGEGPATGAEPATGEGPSTDGRPATEAGPATAAEPATGAERATGEGQADGSPPRRNRRSRGERRSGRGGRGRDVPATGGDPTAIPEDLGLGDLLAGALAAYRDI